MKTLTRDEVDQLGSIANAVDEARSALGVIDGVRFLRKLPDGALDQLIVDDSPAPQASPERGRRR
jgi:hypothetical protein